MMVYVLVRIFVGVLFIISGALKLVPAEYLENDIIRSGLGGDYTAPFMARLVIGSEFFLGAMLISGIFSRAVIRLCVLSLIVYSLYLVYVLVVFGNEGNCGCFGPRIELSPAEGILKNLAIGLLCIYMLRKTPSDKSNLFRKMAAVGLVILSTVLPFVIYQVDLPEKVTVDGNMRELVDFSALYTNSSGSVPAIDVRVGRSLVMFASLGCEHCRIAAGKLEVFKENHPEWNICIIYNGNTSLIPDFHKEARIRLTPCFLFNDGVALAKMAGTKLPAIYLIENSAVVASLTYPELLESNLSNFFGN